MQSALAIAGILGFNQPKLDQRYSVLLGNETLAKAELFLSDEDTIMRIRAEERNGSLISIDYAQTLAEIAEIKVSGLARYRNRRGNESYDAGIMASYKQDNFSAKLAHFPTNNETRAKIKWKQDDWYVGVTIRDLEGESYVRPEIMWQTTKNVSVGLEARLDNADYVGVKFVYEN